ncbi:hypothetical protein RSSM_04972 [Rhodopirellula sallentina SM41]|uniref:Uncharacterized protein n=1 Tax=Rhodopirellula sallentina SM41 TaxID=1263870 RepID=M5TWP6_9BACT|nr:hypothetical protein RSSM_04972 [Rhodopirellula sallentina SM41]
MLNASLANRCDEVKVPPAEGPTHDASIIRPLRSILLSLTNWLPDSTTFTSHR